MYNNKKEKKENNVSRNVLNVKGTMINVALLVFNDHNVEKVLEKELGEKVVKKAGFFSGLPFIIDFNEINDLSLHDVARKTTKILDDAGIHAVGVRCSDNQWPILERLGFFYRDSSRNKQELTVTEKESDTQEQERDEAESMQHTCIEANLVVNRNVRSGQQIYAQNKTLIIYGNVSSGAEIIADGNIIVTGSLKGKAVAGAMGEKNAIIQAGKMEPELLSIAGVFLTSEDLDNHPGVYGNFGLCRMDVDKEEIKFNI
jgi:septum site-determining protein MinC